MVLAIEGLIAQGPGEDASVVLVPLHHLLHSVDIRCFPSRVIRRILCCQREIFVLAAFVVHARRKVHGVGNHVVKAVALEISFVHDPESQFVGHVV
jgi:hypothetical protein